MNQNDEKPELDTRDTPPWLMPVSDEELDQSSGFSFGSLGTIFAIVFVAVSIAGIIYLYQSYESSDKPPQLVKAPTDPVKEKPLDPGGKEIPDQDKKVFDQMQGKAETGGEIDLSKQAEEPLQDIPESQAGSQAVQPDPVAAVTSDTENSGVDSAASNDGAEETLPDTNPVKAPNTATTANADSKQQTKPVAASSNEPVKKAPASSSKQTYSFYRVQLGSFLARKSADTAWATIQKEHPSLTKDMQSYINNAVVSGRSYYRLSVGPLATRTAADNMCLYFRTRGQSCFVVAPTR